MGSTPLYLKNLVALGFLIFGQLHAGAVLRQPVHRGAKFDTKKGRKHMASSPLDDLCVRYNPSPRRVRGCDADSLCLR
jgi:hypothetical protein